MEHDRTPARRERIQALYHAARLLPEGDRRKFLAESSEGDSALEDEVQTLLDQPVSTASFTEVRRRYRFTTAWQRHTSGSHWPAAWRLPRDVAAWARRDG